MLSKSIIAASLLVALAPSSVLGAPVPEAVEVEAREPMIMPLTPFIRPQIGRGGARPLRPRQADLEAREPMIMPVAPRIPPINNIVRRPVGRAPRLYKTRELDLEEREPMIMPLTPLIRPTTLNNIRRRPIGGGLLKAREVEEELSARRLAHLARLGHSSVDMGLHPTIRTRDLSDQELEARLVYGIRPVMPRPIGFKGIKREFDDETLEARQPIFGIIKKIGKGIFGRDLEELDAREWEELEARQPIFGIIKKIGKGIFGRDLEGLDAREWEELEARQPIFGIIKKIGKGIFGRELEDLNARQWEEVLERAVEHHHHHHTRGLELDQLD